MTRHVQRPPLPAASVEPRVRGCGVLTRRIAANIAKLHSIRLCALRGATQQSRQQPHRRLCLRPHTCSFGGARTYGRLMMSPQAAFSWRWKSDNTSRWTEVKRKTRRIGRRVSEGARLQYFTADDRRPDALFVSGTINYCASAPCPPAASRRPGLSRNGAIPPLRKPRRPPACDPFRGSLANIKHCALEGMTRIDLHQRQFASGDQIACPKASPKELPHYQSAAHKSAPLVRC